MLVLADEPTGNLDTKSSDEIAALLKQVAKEWGRAVLMVTHDPRIAAYADRIVFLKDGKIVNEVQLEARRGDNAEAVSQMMKAIA
jgi:putative ABC transport system ATP-binding protein